MNFFAWLRNSQGGGNHQPARHMTWAKSSVGRTVSRTGLFLKKQIWIWPILAVVLLTLIGLVVRQAIETTMRDGLRSQLQTLLDVETAMFETWYNVQESNAESLANNLEIRQTVYSLIEPNDAEDAAQLLCCRGNR